MRTALQIFLFRFCKTKGYCCWKHNFCKLFVRNPASELLQIGQNSEKWQWRHNLPTWRQRHIFWRCFVSLIKFSYWSKFHVNISTGSRIMTIFFHKRLTRNLEIGNTTVWVLPNIWRLGWVMGTKFGTNVPNRMSLNAAKFQGYNFDRSWVIKGKPTGRVKLPPPPTTTQIRVNVASFLTNVIYNEAFFYSLFPKFYNTNFTTADIRSSRRSCSIKNSILENFTICTGKHLNGVQLY